MIIESIKLLKTLKAGTQVWPIGTIVSIPIPQVLLNEAKRGTGIIEILSVKKEVVSEPVRIQIPIPVQAPSPSKPKLVVRKSKSK